MATDIERLVLSMEANMKKFEREFARASGLADRNMRQIERRVEQSEDKVGVTMGRIASNLRNTVGGILAGLTIGNAAQLIDSATKITNSLKVAGLEGQELEKVYQTLFASAQEQGVPLEALVTLYGRAAMAQKELGISSQELANFTTGVATALRVAGTDTQTASGALLQLGQVLAGGKVEWEDFSSLVDGAYPVLLAAAAGIKEAGGSVAKLTQLVKDGKVSSQAFFRGFEAGKSVLDDLAGKTTSTLGQRIETVKNASLDAARKMSDLAGASREVEKAFDALNYVIAYIPKEFEYKLKLLSAMADAAERIVRTVREAAGTTAILSQPLAEGVEPAENPLVVRVKPRGAGAAGRSAATVNPISLDKYPVPGAKDKKGGGGGGADRKDDFEREIEAIRRRTRALDDERSVVGESAYEVARSEAALRLEEAAKKANLAVTEDMQIKIDQLSSAYGRAKVALDEAEKKQREFEEASQFAGASLSDAFKDAILNGEKLINVIDKLLKSLASRGIDSIFDTLFAKGGAGSNFLSSIAGAVTGKGYADGGYTGPGGKHTPAGIVHRGEYVMDAASVRRLGRRNLDALRRGRGYAAGGYVGAPLAPMSPPAVRPGSMGRGRASFTNAPTYNITPAAGVTPQQLAVVLEQHDRELNRTFGQRFAMWKENN